MINSFDIIDLSKNEIKSNQFRNITCAEFKMNEGWHILNIKTYRPFSNEIQSYFAGYIEGYIYHQLIRYHYINIYESIFNGKDLNENLRLFLKKQDEFVRNLTIILENKSNYSFLIVLKSKDSEKNEDEYHKVLKYTILQRDGLYRGQKDGSIKYKKTPLSEEQLNDIINQADLNDLIPAFQNQIPAGKDESIIKEEKNLENRGFLKRECSGFVRYNNLTENLITAHTTHNVYSLLNRVYKSYDFDFHLNERKLNTFNFASRPGDLNSKDDFYILSNGMSIIETSLEIFNLELFKNLSPKTIPKWIRNNISNRLAKNNTDWINIFFKYNSGTHNDQWLLVDYNKFEEFISNKNKKNNTYTQDKNLLQEIPSNIIHLVEQIPILDKAYYLDVTERLLNDGYVASYNAPFFKEVIINAGYYNSTTHSDYFTAKRFHLFKKLNKNASNIEDIMKLMEYHDKEDICDTIAPRCDTIENFAFGSVDGKITDRDMIKNMKSKIKYGPPYIKGITKPFNFSMFNNVSHLGIPEYFDFKWIDA